MFIVSRTNKYIHVCPKRNNEISTHSNAILQYNLQVNKHLKIRRAKYETMFLYTLNPKPYDKEIYVQIWIGKKIYSSTTSTLLHEK